MEDKATAKKTIVEELRESDGNICEFRMDIPGIRCYDFGGEEGTNGEGYDFACSACGYCCDIPEPSYCPNCGAKAVER